MNRADDARRALARLFDVSELRTIKRPWLRHSLAEDRRNVDGLIATLTDDCAYEMVPTGQRWAGHAGARVFKGELFRAFPDNRFALRDSRRATGRVRGCAPERHQFGTVGRQACLGPAGQPGGADPVPVGSGATAFRGERIWFDRGAIESGEVRPD